MNIDEIRQLAQLLRESPEVGSIEVRSWFGRAIAITRNGVQGAGGAGYPVMPPGAMPAASGGRLESTPVPTQRAPEAAGPALKEIKSPMVGTFYMAPEPGAEPYVKVGTRVSPGQTVCIIEAMKIMNEIEAELSGVVREICVEDTQPVEFGQVLYRVDPNG